MRLFKSALVSVALLSGALVAPVSHADAVAALVVDPSTLGSAAATAAGSCWEIKQARPTATDGAYWLLTPKMYEPQQFYCDMTTDGGGWVLIGKGRDGWTSDYDGQRSPTALLTPDTVPMSSTTVQLPSSTVSALTNGARVDSLQDGIRLQRAQNTAGSSWQEVRFSATNWGKFSWTFGAEYRLGSWSFSGSTGSGSGTGGTSPTFGSDQAYRRVVNKTDTAHQSHLGFMYGTSVRGLSSATSYLWTPTDNAASAIPYTRVFIRPRVTSSDPGFTAIPDSGTAAYHIPKVAKSIALDSPWGVSGLAGATGEEGNVEVQAFTQSGDNMYVGGNFKYVQKDASGTGQVSQPFLAAFNNNTGEWHASFRPQLNEQVRALATLPNGDVVAAGSFSQANAQPATAIVALNPTTGATDTGWKLSLENRLAAGVLRVNALTISGQYLYIGGALTHLAGGSKPTTFQYERSVGRVLLTDGTASSDWNPNLNGTVTALSGSPDGTRMYAVGYFGLANGVAASRAAAVLTASGAALAAPAWSPTWSNANKNYQRSVDAVGDKVWVGGSEHSLFQFNTTTFARVQGNIFKDHGDVQHIADSNGVVYAGCHCSLYGYTNAFTWSALNSDWTQADAMDWIGAWDATTGERISEFTPNLGMRSGSGIWAIEGDTNGTVWAGGDIDHVHSVTTAGAWSGGFARFGLDDSTPPAAPADATVTGQTATTVTLSWTKTPDPSGTHYQVLLDDRPIATSATNTVTVPKGGNGRYFVRSADAVGNISASSAVVKAGSGQAPTAAFTSTVGSAGAVSFDGSGSSDPDGTVSSYAWNFGDTQSGSGVSANHTYTASGNYDVTLTVTDSSGISATTTHTVTPSLGGATTAQVVAKGQPWAWRYVAGAPPTGWNARTFDATTWIQGGAPLGFGSSSIATKIDSAFAATSDRPLAAYFTKSFSVADSSKVTRLVLTSVADDGAVFYVNGTQVATSNMRPGPVTYQSYAGTARNTTVANASPVVIDVPTSLLVNATNTIAVETHLNSRATKDVSFDLSAALTTTS